MHLNSQKKQIKNIAKSPYQNQIFDWNSKNYPKKEISLIGVSLSRAQTLEARDKAWKYITQVGRVQCSILFNPFASKIPEK